LQSNPSSSKVQDIPRTWLTPRYEPDQILLLSENVQNCFNSLQKMSLKTAKIQLRGILGVCGDRKVFLGFASARMLADLSFPDVLDESTGKGYQRRFNRQHSFEFKKYIQNAGASTIPLTFNLRADRAECWSLDPNVVEGSTILTISGASTKVMAQVDGQHRLGYLGDSGTEFAFMTFIGLSVAEEMDVFRVINGKAKGLSGSLLDFTEARLAGGNLQSHKPELYIALRLHEDERSPWHGRLDLGGGRVVGNQRQASLRTMQNAAKRFLREAKAVNCNPELAVGVLIAFWRAIAFVLERQWEQPRKHMLTKGIGVYCLMSIGGLLATEAHGRSIAPDFDFFIATLSDFIDRIDWSNNGPLKGFGGASGADAAFTLLKQERTRNRRNSETYGKQEHSVN
jgi:DNA sulfur modification protein DndB